MARTCWSLEHDGREVTTENVADKLDVDLSAAELRGAALRDTVVEGGSWAAATAESRGSSVSS